MVCLANRGDVFILILQTLLPGPLDGQLWSKDIYLEKRTHAGPPWPETLSLFNFVLGYS